MGRKSKDKGSGFERQIAKILSDAFGVQLRRTPMSGGWAQQYEGAAGDLVCVDSEFPYCVECKKEEGWRLESLFTSDHQWFDDWWEQLMRECPKSKRPLLIFSRNRAPIFVASNWLPYAESRLSFTNVDGSVIYVTSLDMFLTEDIRCRK